MFLSRSRPLIAILVLLAFVGQTMASTLVPCQMDTQKDLGMAMDTLNHSTDTMNGDFKMVEPGSKSASDDCCDQHYTCSMGSCASVLLSAAHFESGAVVLSQKFTPALDSLIDHPHTFLYRPPILC